MAAYLGGGSTVRLHHIVECRDQAYVMDHKLTGVIGRNDPRLGVPMSEAAIGATRQGWRPLAIVAGVIGVLIAGTVALWAFYGTAVFHEMILAGIAMCM